MGKIPVKRLLGLTAATITLVGVSGSPAFAAGNAVEGPQQSPPPSCVEVTIDNGAFSKTAHVYNFCSSTQRVKVLWAYASDSECMSIHPNHVRTDSAVEPTRFDGLQAC